MVKFVTLDGYELLKLSQMNLPEEVYYLKISGFNNPKQYNDIISDHLSEFKSLRNIYIENQPYLNDQFFKLYTIPNLNILKLPCNMIKEVTYFKQFNHLEILDLSYNLLHENIILKELLISCPKLIDLNLAIN